MVVSKSTFDRVLEIIDLQKEVLNEPTEKQMLQNKTQIIDYMNTTSKSCCIFCGSDFSRYTHPIESGGSKVDGLTIESITFKCSACDNKSKIFFIPESNEEDAEIAKVIDIQIIKNGKWTSNWKVEDLPYADKDTISNPQWLQSLLDGRYPDGILCKVKDHDEDDYRVDVISDYDEVMGYEGKASYWDIAEPVYFADSITYKGDF